MSKLYMVAVPIGNLEDITLRALRILKEVNFIACEDTRHSGKLLKAYEIEQRLFACHVHNEEQSLKGIIKELNEGKDGAYISDAGTPGISDPGGRLVEGVIAAGHDVVPIPGPSAFSALLSVLGLPLKSVVFGGFLSPKSGRRKKQLTELMTKAQLMVIYESPFRICALLEDIKTLSPESYIVLGRELTKIHEEIIRGSVDEVLTELEGRPSIKGEIVLALSIKSMLISWEIDAEDA